MILPLRLDISYKVTYAPFGAVLASSTEDFIAVFI